MQQERGSGTRQLHGDRFPQSIGRSGNQDDLLNEWSHLVLPISESLLKRKQSSGDDVLSPALALVEFDQFLDRRRIFQLFISLSRSEVIPNYEAT